jgi:hypothetical protein
LIERILYREKVLTGHHATAPSNVVELLGRVPQGERNDACTSLAGHLLAHGHTEAEALSWLDLWRDRCDPPLGKEEIGRVVSSVAMRVGAVGIEPTTSAL